MTPPNRFIKNAKHPLISRMILFLKLPAAFFSGIRVKALDPDKCSITVPYKWFTKNPFRSTYFACLAMAAEMSTGLLAQACIYKKNPAVSMLVVKLEANYFKKAAGLTCFTCFDGSLIQEAVEKCISNGAAQAVKARSIGLNDAGEAVAEFFITWSFKVKQSRIND